MTRGYLQFSQEELKETKKLNIVIICISLFLLLAGAAAAGGKMFVEEKVVRRGKAKVK